MSRIEDRGRVVFHPGGTATVYVGDGDHWRVYEVDGFWTADSPVQGFLRSRVNGAFRATFHTRGEVLAALGVEVSR